LEPKDTSLRGISFSAGPYLIFKVSLRLLEFIFISSTRFFIEINFVLYSSFSDFLSTNNSSTDRGYTLVRLNPKLEGYLAMTFRLLFFLIALNFSVPLDALSLFRQYFLN
jgi:hypothetical protein